MNPATEQVTAPRKSAYHRHLDACGRCRRAQGTLQLCDTGANLFRQEQEQVTADKAELLPCPFCGAGPAVTSRRNSDLIDIFEIRCAAQDCMFIPRISVRVENSKYAIAAWNTRASMAGYETAIEALKRIEAQHYAIGGEALPDPNRYCAVCVTLHTGRSKVYPCKTVKIARTALAALANATQPTLTPGDARSEDDAAKGYRVCAYCRKTTKHRKATDCWNCRKPLDATQKETK